MKRKKLLWVLIALLMFAVIGCADQGKNGNNNTGNTNNTDNTDNG